MIPTTAFVDQCILEGECDETSAECRVHFGDCPIAAPKGGTHVRWVKLGSHVKQPSLLEARSSVPKLGTTKRCLYAKSMPDSAEAGHHIEVPVTRPCPDINEKAGDEEEDMKGLADEWLWMLNPAFGPIVPASDFAICPRIRLGRCFLEDSFLCHRCGKSL